MPIQRSNDLVLLFLGEGGQGGDDVAASFKMFGGFELEFLAHDLTVGMVDVTHLIAAVVVGARWSLLIDGRHDGEAKCYHGAGCWGWMGGKSGRRGGVVRSAHKRVSGFPAMCREEEYSYMCTERGVVGERRELH